uniref:Uncharacterized protein n=1 Tax=Amphora coffeiformis TaxID=265554 RepID=A0A7S3P409_9STRA
MTKVTASGRRISAGLYMFLICLLSLQIRPTVAFSRYSRPGRARQRQQLVAPHVAAADETSSKAAGCPFERAFPRYKIDLRNTKDKSKKGLLSKVVKAPSLLREWQSTAQLQVLKSKYPDSHVAVHLGLDGAHAMAVLWETAADFLTNTENPSSRANNVVIALEDRTLSQNFCVIFDWAVSHVPDLQDVKHLLQVEFLAEDKAVRLAYTVNDDSNDVPLRKQPLHDSNEINQHTQAWVQRVLVKMGICPFTKSRKMSGQGLSDVGVPVGKIAYHTSSAINAIVLLADTWKAMVEFLDAGPEAQSSILLAAPAYDDTFGTWAGPIFCLLESTVVAAHAEADLGVVCFHPAYATPDGTTWPGFGHMHSVPRLAQWVQQEQDQRQKEKQGTFSPLSREDIAAGGAWQRRTPHSTINVLRADQLARAEGRRDSASLYPRNIRALLAVGNEQLQHDLEQERLL